MEPAVETSNAASATISEPISVKNSTINDNGAQLGLITPGEASVCSRDNLISNNGSVANENLDALEDLPLPASSTRLSYIPCESSDPQTPKAVGLQRSNEHGRITPESIRPLPKTAPRKQKAGIGRKKLSSEILTSTPVKERLRTEQSLRKLKNITKITKRKLDISKQGVNVNDESKVKKKRKGNSKSNENKRKQRCVKKTKEVQEENNRKVFRCTK